MKEIQLMRDSAKKTVLEPPEELTKHRKILPCVTRIFVTPNLDTCSKLYPHQKRTEKISRVSIRAVHRDRHVPLGRLYSCLFIASALPHLGPFHDDGSCCLCLEMFSFDL